MRAGAISLLPAVSKLNRWVRRIQDLLLASPVQDAAGHLSERQYRENAMAAVRQYSRGIPRRLLREQVLTESEWEYDIPPDWVNEFSQFEGIEFPVDDSLQTREWLDLAAGLAIDERRGKWRFTADLPVSGDTARLYYTAEHALDDYSDTVPARHFEATAMHAAGLCLLELANPAAGRSGPAIEAGAIERRTQQEQCHACGKAMIQQAERGWGYTRSWSVGPEPFRGPTSRRRG
ncbi:MAG: hypothetical protein HY321_14450 [Armatimonadetes bacterium]|nr:hypothetical protein [Armatimonadota bacterium]